MLADRNIIKINDQIADELKNLKYRCHNNEDKTECLKRIAMLKELLNSQPSQKEIVNQLADAIALAVDSRNPKKTESESLLDTILKTF